MKRKTLLSKVLLTFVVAFFYLANVSLAEEVSWSSLINSLPDYGLAVSFKTRLQTSALSDWNDWAVKNRFEEIKVIPQEGAFLSWSFSPHFTLGLQGLVGRSAFIGNFYELNNQNWYSRISLSLATFDLLGMYRLNFGKHGQFFASGGIGFITARIQTIESCLNDFKTRDLLFSGSAPAFEAFAGYQYRYNKLFGLSIDAGFLGAKIKDLYLADEKMDEEMGETFNLPEVDVSGFFLSLAFNLHL